MKTQVGEPVAAEAQRIQLDRRQLPLVEFELAVDGDRTCLKGLVEGLEKLDEFRIEVPVNLMAGVINDMQVIALLGQRMVTNISNDRLPGFVEKHIHRIFLTLEKFFHDQPVFRHNLL